MSILPALSISRRPVLGFMAMGVLWGSFAAQVPVLKEHIGADDALFGLVLLGSPLGLIATMWLAPVLDRRLRDLSLPLSAAALAMAYLIPGIASSALWFFLAMLGLGLTSGVLDIVSNARVSELEASTGRPLMNANHGMFSVAYAISAIATGFAREAGVPPLPIFAFLSALVIVAAFFMRMAVTHVDEEEHRSVHLPAAVVWLCGGIVLTAFFVEAVVESWSALHIERTLGGNAAEGAFAPAILGITMAVGRLSGQALAGRVTDRSIIAWGSGIAFVGAAIAAIASLPSVAYLGFGLMGLGVSVVGPLALALVGRLVPRAHRATAVARVNVIGFAAFILAPLIMGQVSDAFGLRVAFGVVAVLALASPFMVAALERR
ncbi:MFS transporter [Gymnodinialimonas sp. 2305UL16-5]|uniref:MFS transporter n=1 Tax=Gymnodinialimonas mytili TaxID=3126503 RepID=UPI00309A63DE